MKAFMSGDEMLPVYRIQDKKAEGNSYNCSRGIVPVRAVKKMSVKGSFGGVYCLGYSLFCLLS